MLTACVSNPERGECGQNSTSGSPDVHINPVSKLRRLLVPYPSPKERLFVSMKTVDAAGPNVPSRPQ